MYVPRVGSFAVYYRDNFKLFQTLSPSIRLTTESNIARAPKISIALVVWIVCLDRPNAARGGRETAFRGAFSPDKGLFLCLKRLPNPVNNNLKANAVLRNYLESAKRPITTYCNSTKIIWNVYPDMK